MNDNIFATREGERVHEKKEAFFVFECKAVLE